MRKVAKKQYNIPMLGEKAPAFEAETTRGKITFPKDYEGKWVVLFSHPADFTPVCTSEVASFASMQGDFKKLGVELLGLSVDSVRSHLAWLKTIQEKIDFNGYHGQEIEFPIIADMDRSIARKYGMIQPKMSDTKAVRAVFIVDPKGLIRTVLYYPLSTGRNFAEIKRIITALQMGDRYGMETPADWMPGDKFFAEAPENMLELEEALLDDEDCQDWFFCPREIPERNRLN